MTGSLAWRHSFRRTVLAAALFAALLPGMTRAQVVGANLAGRIVDDGGGTLPGVTVTITNKANGAQQSVVTNEQGAWRVISLQPAPYTAVSYTHLYRVLRKMRSAPLSRHAATPRCTKP